nr:SOS response-associated peptidase [Acidimicrobiia bacterium]
LPHYFYRTDGQPLAFAGLWSSWKEPETQDRVLTCTIITGRPNGLVADIHDRMPVVLPEESWSRWLDRSVEDRAELESLLTVYPDSEMGEHPVSTLVNSVTNNLPECIAPLETGAVEQ